MKALTIRQPYAWAVARGFKDVENRPSAFTYRGPVMIHAGQQLGSHLAFHQVADLSPVEVPSLSSPLAPVECSFGAVIAVAELVSAHPASVCEGECSPWAIRGSAHLRVADARILKKAVPANGNTILWTPDAALVAAVRRQLP